MAARVDHRVHRARSADYFPARPVQLPIVQPRLRLGLVRPVVARLKELRKRGRDVDLLLLVRPARLDQGDRRHAVGGQAVREHAARGASTDDDVVERVAHCTAVSFIHITSQWWPSRSRKLQPYMKSWSIGSFACAPPAATALLTISSTSARLPHDSARNASVFREGSHGPFVANERKNGSVRSMQNALSLTTMQAALSSVNFGLKVNPRREKKSIDFFRSRTARLTKSLRIRRYVARRRRQ